MSYTFHDIAKKHDISLDVQNCTIKGNKSAYVLKDGTITKYELVKGKIDKKSKDVVSRIELTNYQMNFINLIKGKDGNASVLDNNDFAMVSSKSIQEEMNALYKQKNMYQVVCSKARKNKIELGIESKKDNDIKTIGIKFERKGFFKSIGNGIKSFFQKSFCKNVEDYKEVDIKDVFGESMIEIKPSYEYTAKEGEKPYVLANELGISLYRLKAANPESNLDWKTTDGQKIIIPKTAVVKNNTIMGIADIAQNVGISESYIRDIIFGIEGSSFEPALKPYYDNVPTSKNSKGVLTIGFGHTNRVFGEEMNSNNMNKIEITEAQAYQLLAQDLLDAKLDALQYFGKDFIKAPQSIQDAIIDVIFNKGVERGLDGIVRDEKGRIKEERLDTPTRQLKEDLRKGDYAAAAVHVIYETPVKGLKKRNVYRAIGSLKDLKPKDREVAIQNLESYAQSVVLMYNGAERDTLEAAWLNAKNGIYDNFFNKAERDTLETEQ